jgi:hypothetical protein
VAYLLMYGHLPTQAEYDNWVYQVTHHTYVHENIKSSWTASGTTRTRWVCFRFGRRALDLLPEAKDHRRQLPAHVSAVRMNREDAHPRRLRLPGAPWASRTSTRTTTSPTRATSSRCSSRWQSLPTSPTRASRRPRRALHPPRRPRAELLGAAVRYVGRPADPFYASRRVRGSTVPCTGGAKSRSQDAPKGRLHRQRPGLP